MLGLRVPKFVILAVPVGYQFRVDGLMHYGSIMEHGNLIAEFAARQAADADGRFVTSDVAELGSSAAVGSSGMRKGASL